MRAHAVPDAAQTVAPWEQSRPAHGAPRPAREVASAEKDTMLTLVIHTLTIMLWAVAAVAACGIALGFLARTITGRAPYRNHSRLVQAAIRWEKNWHR